MTLAELLRQLEVRLLQPADATEVLGFERRFVVTAEETTNGGRQFVLADEYYAAPGLGTSLAEATLDAVALDVARAERASTK